MYPWLLLLACRLPPSSMPESEVVLGWRLAPGMEISYRLRSTHQVELDTVVREETWSYLVRRVDSQGTATLEGRLQELDAAILNAGTPLEASAMAAAIDAERQRLGPQPVTMTLSLDGRVDRLEARDWADALPHRLLALQLPVGPVRVGDRWTDAETARSYARLVPAAEEVRFTGTHRLEQLALNRHLGTSGNLLTAPRHLDAEISTEALVLPEDARFPAVELEGISQWNLDAGRLDERVLHIYERGGTRPEQAGRLELELAWFPTRKARRENH